MTRAPRVLGTAVCLVLLAGGSADRRVNGRCDPGLVRRCACESGGTGVQSCGADGSRWLGCAACGSMEAAIDGGAVFGVPGNLVPNAFLSPARAKGEAPAGWTFGAWGANRAKGSWLPSGGVLGGRALRVDVSDYRDGDAKWSFDRVKLAGDTWYSYSDYHRSDGRSRILLSCRKTADATVRNRSIGQSDASATWRRESVRFYLGPAADCEATILHLLDRNGFLETDLPALAPVQPRPLARPLVSLAFDDGWRSAVNRGRADLEARGLVGSYYLGESLIGDPDGHYASRAELQALLAEAARKGHEIGSHAAHHRRLSALRGRLRWQEMKANADWLSTLGVSRAGLAYPLGDFDAATEAQARALHAYARTSLEGLNDAATDRYRIEVLPVTTETETATILARIDDAAARRRGSSCSSTTWAIPIRRTRIGRPTPNTSPCSTDWPRVTSRS